MPKLAAKDRKKVEKAEAATSEFPLIPPGKYMAELTGVEARTSNAGNPMWVAEFRSITGADGTTYPGRQWLIINLVTSDERPDGWKPGPKNRIQDPDEAWVSYQQFLASQIKSFFEAFGFTPDSDTDEMIGERAIIQIGQRTIQSGTRAGEQANQVNGIFPLDSVDWSDEVGTSGGGKDENNF